MAAARTVGRAGAPPWPRLAVTDPRRRRGDVAEPSSLHRGPAPDRQAGRRRQFRGGRGGGDRLLGATRLGPCPDAGRWARDVPGHDRPLQPDGRPGALASAAVRPRPPRRPVSPRRGWGPRRSTSADPRAAKRRWTSMPCRIAHRPATPWPRSGVRRPGRGKSAKRDGPVRFRGSSSASPSAPPTRPGQRSRQTLPTWPPRPSRRGHDASDPSSASSAATSASKRSPAAAPGPPEDARPTGGRADGSAGTRRSSPPRPARRPWRPVRGRGRPGSG